ncbi:MAG: UTP--glucose-1-phosphate uridylyltransferase, partial [Pseudobdellovibrionaceae bacterium]
HGLFAVDALLTALHPKKLPQTGNQKKLVTAIANGEDLNSLPDPVIVEWTIKNKIPVVLVTTTKTAIDNKGGILTLVKDTQTGELFLKVVETAVAKAAGQLEVFEKTSGLVSTNLTLFNHEVLSEKLKKLTEVELLHAMAPDVVLNWKEQKDQDGVTRKYLQLEGTMGTSIMNLDRVFRKRFGEPLVYVVNIEASRRTDFFSPIKSAFDYFMQFHSDRFGITQANYKLRHFGGENLPAFTLKDPATKDAYYQDVQNVLFSFQKTSVRGLKNLQINGQVLIRNMVLQDHVQIKNETGQLVDISDLSARLPKDTDGRPLLKNIHIQWTKEQVLIQSIEGQTL